ncbi:MAG: RNA 2',3'-cyclic phosphodiesterase [Steroidobacteraceae bacterium]
MNEPTQRLFFALWPEPGQLEPLIERVRRLVPPSAGRAQRPDQWHVTVEFLGAIVESRMAEVRAAGAAAAADAHPFEIVFDRLDHWRRPRVLCLTASETPLALAQLSQSLRRGLGMRGFEVERREFRAHLTLARKVDQPPPPLVAFEPVRWPAHGLTLVRSVSDSAGSRYEPLAAWNTGVG